MKNKIDFTKISLVNLNLDNYSRYKITSKIEDNKYILSFIIGGATLEENQATIQEVLQQLENHEMSTSSLATYITISTDDKEDGVVKLRLKSNHYKLGTLPRGVFDSKNRFTQLFIKTFWHTNFYSKMYNAFYFYPEDFRIEEANEKWGDNSLLRVTIVVKLDDLSVNNENMSIFTITDVEKDVFINVEHIDSIKFNIIKDIIKHFELKHILQRENLLGE